MDLILTHGQTGPIPQIAAPNAQGHPRGVLPSTEEFSVGPLCQLATPSDLNILASLREGFWSTGYGTSKRRIKYDEFDNYFSIIGNAERVEIWVGHGVQEQVFLFFLGAAFRAGIVSVPTLRLVQFRDPDQATVLGTCGPDILCNPPPAVPVDEVRLDRLAACWRAIAAPEPAALNRLLAEGSGDALADRSLLGYTARFPRPDSGLDAFDLLLLRHVGPDFAWVGHIIVNTLRDMMAGSDMIGDLLLHDRLIRMARSDLPRPLLEYQGPSQRIQEMEVRLTPFGEACLQGRENAIAANGIDRRVGGMHLSSAKGTVWVWDGSRLVPG